MKLIEFISQKLPTNNFKRILRRLFYSIVFSFPLKNDKYLLINKIEAKFKRYPFCKIHAHEFNLLLEGYTKYRDIKGGDIVIDAGSIPGEFTIYASKKAGKTGKVLSFEPDENHFKMLKDNIKLNKLVNVIPLKMGIWSEDAVLNLPEGKMNVVSLDNQLKRMNIEKVDFIKMDIEGAEIDAVKGMEETLKNNNVHLAIASYHIINGQKTNIKLEKMLKGVGYKVKTDYPKHLTTYAFKDR